MIRLLWVGLLFALTASLSFYVYSAHPKRLVYDYTYAFVVDILAWISGGLLVCFSLAYAAVLPPLVAWPQALIGIGIASIHLARFLVRHTRFWKR